MLEQINEKFNFHKEVLNLRNERQKVLAGNIANADTPNYKARDFDFSSELAKVMQQGRAGDEMTVTSARHITSAESAAGTSSLHSLQYRISAQGSIDGNTVDMETERVHFADNSVRTQASLSFLNSYIQGMKSAMKQE